MKMPKRTEAKTEAEPSWCRKSCLRVPGGEKRSNTGLDIVRMLFIYSFASVSSSGGRLQSQFSLMDGLSSFCTRDNKSLPFIRTGATKLRTSNWDCWKAAKLRCVIFKLLLKFYSFNWCFLGMLLCILLPFFSLVVHIP